MLNASGFDLTSGDIVADRRCLVVLAGSAVVLLGAAPARAATNGGVAKRPFTDGGAVVPVVKGSLKCSNARSLVRRYWGTRADAFDRRITLRHAGLRWTCRPTTPTFPYRWSCVGGRDGRFRVTARE